MSALRAGLLLALSLDLCCQVLAGRDVSREGADGGPDAWSVRTMLRMPNGSPGSFMTMAMDPTARNRLFASDKHAIYVITTDITGTVGMEVFVNGSGTPGTARDGPRIGVDEHKASQAMRGTGSGPPPAIISQVHGLCVDMCGNLFVADGGNFSVRRVDASTGYISTIAGLSGQPGVHDGAGDAAQFSAPASLICTPSGDILVGDTGERALRVIHSSKGCSEQPDSSHCSSTTTALRAAAFAVVAVFGAGVLWTAASWLIARADIPGRIRAAHEYHAARSPSRHPSLTDDHAPLLGQDLLIDVSESDGNNRGDSARDPSPLD